jgi:hypothetical protein
MILPGLRRGVVAGSAAAQASFDVAADQDGLGKDERRHYRCVCPFLAPEDKDKPHYSEGDGNQRDLSKQVTERQLPLVECTPILAFCPAIAVPITVKMPEPITAPMPSAVSDQGPRDFGRR